MKKRSGMIIGLKDILTGKAILFNLEYYILLKHL